MNDAGVIHCDLKPENILLCTRWATAVMIILPIVLHATFRYTVPHLIGSVKPAEIKIIDFGSACMEDRTVYSYIQVSFSTLALLQNEFFWFWCVQIFCFFDRADTIGPLKFFLDISILLCINISFFFLLFFSERVLVLPWLLQFGELFLIFCIMSFLLSYSWSSALWFFFVRRNAEFGCLGVSFFKSFLTRRCCCLMNLDTG